MPERLVVVGEYFDYGEAELIAGALRANGIRAVLPHDNRQRMVGRSPGGLTLSPSTRTGTNVMAIELLVEPRDETRALDVIAAFNPSTLPTDFDNEEIHEWLTQKAARYRQRRQQYLKRSRIRAVIICTSMIVLGLAAFVNDRYRAGLPPTLPPARIGLGLTATGEPEIVTVQCPGRKLKAVQVREHTKTDPGSTIINPKIAWAAILRPHREGRPSMLLGRQINDYDVYNATNGLGAGPYELDTIESDITLNLLPTGIVFTPADLRRDELLTQADDTGPRTYTPRSEFNAPLPDC